MKDGNAKTLCVGMDDGVHGRSERACTTLRRASARVSRRSPSQGLWERVVNERYIQRAMGTVKGTRTVRVVFGWDFEEGRECLLVPIDRRSDLFRDLYQLR